ncbi:MAG: YifB family Mg chelatase-like AAA ATPase [Clostridia bacterium]|nr:YifB family Mg chelatase-like AAA ATPase [Clostridia bacterium]
MFSRVSTLGLYGLRGYTVDAETDISRGIPEFKVVGMCGTGAQETAKRVRTAMLNQGYDFPPGRVIVNLAPADVRKDGGKFDLPIAIGILAAMGIISAESIKDTAFLGEMSLDGCLREVRGALPMALCANKNGIKRIVIPKHNMCEIVPSGINAVGVKSLREAVLYLKNGSRVITKPIENLKQKVNENDREYDFSDIFGQSELKRAVEVAVSGCHNILLMGCRGSGKTMISKCIPGILPKMSEEEIIETASVYSAAGMPSDGCFSGIRPFRAVHAGITPASLMGGGRFAVPGEISLAHNGVLFMDELTEVQIPVIEALRQPLEEHFAVISKYGSTEKFPADFLFVGAANPCKCGNLFEGGGKCTCNKMQIKSKLMRISNPILDRIDIHIPVKSVRYAEMKKSDCECSADIKKRVERTRQIQFERYSGQKNKLNGRIDRRQIEKYCRPDKKAKRLLSAAVDELGFSIRGYEKVLRLARTIADMDCRADITEYDIAEALQYRWFDRPEVADYGRVS